jgi:hypothetical protein
MEQSHNEEPIRQAGKVPNPEERIENRGLESRQVGRTAGDRGVPKRDPPLLPALNIEPLFRKDIFEGIHESRKVAPQPDHPIEEKGPKPGPKEVENPVLLHGHEFKGARLGL